MNDEPRKSSHALQYTTFVLVALVLYPLSRGPVAWLGWHTNLPEWFWEIACVVYFPLDAFFEIAPPALETLHDDYIRWLYENSI